MSYQRADYKPNSRASRSIDTLASEQPENRKAFRTLAALAALTVGTLLIDRHINLGDDHTPAPDGQAPAEEIAGIDMVD